MTVHFKHSSAVYSVSENCTLYAASWGTSKETVAFYNQLLRRNFPKPPRKLNPNRNNWAKALMRPSLPPRVLNHSKNKPIRSKQWLQRVKQLSTTHLPLGLRQPRKVTISANRRRRLKHVQQKQLEKIRRTRNLRKVINPIRRT